MSVTKQQLRADLTAAMRAQDKVRTRTLRSVLTALSQAEVAGTEAVELAAEQVQDVVGQEAKRRRDAIEEFSKAHRDDLVGKETEELAVLTEYLPQQLTEAEIDGLVAEAITETGAAGEGARAMGRVMGVVVPRTKGRADGKIVAASVRRQLG